MALTRKAADAILIRPFCPLGCFVIRSSESAYSLSAKVFREGVHKVGHYKIFVNDYGGFYIMSPKMFRRMEDLVKHYRRHPVDSHCGKLGYSLMGLTKYALDSDKGWISKGNEEGSEADDQAVCINIRNTGPIDKIKCNKMTTAMQNLHHARLVKILGMFSIGEKTVILTEHMKRGSLLKRLKNQDVSLADQLIMAIKVAECMAYLEKQNFVHCDLRAESIFVDDNDDLKIGKLALPVAQQTSSATTCSENVRFRWCAPEIEECNQCSIKSDVWAFGVLLWEIFSHGRLPYEGTDNDRELAVQIARGQRLEKPTACPVDVFKIMKSCWNLEPDQRPSFAKLLKQIDLLLNNLHATSYFDVPDSEISGNEAIERLMTERQHYLEQVFIATDDRLSVNPFLAAIYYRQPTELQQKLRNQQKGIYDKWYGWTVKYVSNVPSREGCYGTSYVKERKLPLGQTNMSKMRMVINANADVLFSKHSNMTILTGSPIKISGFGSDDVRVEQTPTIVIYCTKKHLIPEGEGVFPKFLEEFNVDVREGRLYALGDVENSARSRYCGYDVYPGCIVSSPDLCGSLGGFVLIGNTRGFITSGHTFLGLAEDTPINTLGRQCGRLSTVVFSNEEVNIPAYEGEVTWGIDAAFVTLDQDTQCCTQLRLSETVQAEYQDYGMPNPVIFTNNFAQLSRIYEFTPIFKFGHRTKFTEGQVSFYGTAARLVFSRHKLKTGATQFVAKNLLTVTSNVNLHSSSTSNYFADKGDSGAFAFVLEDGTPKLAGIVTWSVDETCFLLVPLEPVLHYLGARIDESAS